jgi:hypothetical protein
LVAVGGLGIVVAAGGLELWRKTLGDAALLTPALAMSVALVAMLGLLTMILGLALAFAGWPLRPGNARKWIGLGVVVAAGGLVLSRKTLGGAALLTPALALALAACTGIAAQRPGPGQRGRAVDHLLAVGLVLWTAAGAWADRSNLFMAAALLVGVLVGLLGGVTSLRVLVGPTRVRSPD